MIFLDIIYLNMLTGEYSSKLGLREGFLNLFFFFFLSTLTACGSFWASDYTQAATVTTLDP